MAVADGMIQEASYPRGSGGRVVFSWRHWVEVEFNSSAGWSWRLIWLGYVRLCQIAWWTLLDLVKPIIRGLLSTFPLRKNSYLYLVHSTEFSHTNRETSEEEKVRGVAIGAVKINESHCVSFTPHHTTKLLKCIVFRGVYITKGVCFQPLTLSLIKHCYQWISVNQQNLVSLTFFLENLRSELLFIFKMTQKFFFLFVFCSMVK